MGKRCLSVTRRKRSKDIVCYREALKRTASQRNPFLLRGLTKPSSLTDLLVKKAGSHFGRARMPSLITRQPPRLAKGGRDAQASPCVTPMGCRVVSFTTARGRL